MHNRHRPTAFSPHVHYFLVPWFTVAMCNPTQSTSPRLLKQPTHRCCSFPTALTAYHVIQAHSAKSRKAVKLLASKREVHFKHLPISHIATATAIANASRKHLASCYVLLSLDISVPFCNSSGLNSFKILYILGIQWMLLSRPTCVQ